MDKSNRVGGKKIDLANNWISRIVRDTDDMRLASGEDCGLNVKPKSK